MYFLEIPKAVPATVLTAIIPTLGIGILISFTKFDLHVFPGFFLFQKFLNVRLYNLPKDISIDVGVFSPFCLLFGPVN